MDIKVIGIDIAKRYFQVHGIDSTGVAVLRRKVTRGRFLKLFTEISPCIIGIEAGSGAHHWARELAKLGHEAPRLFRSLQLVRRSIRDEQDDEQIFS